MMVGASFTVRSIALCIAAALVLVGTAIGELSREGLVVEYHFDGDAKDSSGNGIDGIIYGANFVDGKFGKALSFDGVDDYVKFGYIGNRIDNDFTIDMWVNSNEWAANDRDLISNHQAFVDNDYSFQIIWWGSALRFAWSPGTWTTVVLTSDPPIDQWFHLVFTFNDATNEWKYYENALLINSGIADINLREPNKELQIGRETYINYFNGKIDEVRIYNRALNAEEIKANYEVGQKRQTVTTTPTPAATPSEPESSAVWLHGEKTDVVLGEDVLLKLSAVNLITKPPMTVQVMIYPPSGMSVTSSEFVKSGAGIYTTTYSLNRGEGRDIEVRIKTNQVGDFNVKGRIVYYFGDNQSTAEDHTLNLPIKVRKEDASAQNEGTPAQKTPGFGVISCINVILLIFLKNRGIKE